MKLPEDFWEWPPDEQEKWILGFIREACGVGPRLTPREKQIARMLRDGVPQLQIGKQLKLSPRAVKCHLQRTYKKLGVRNQIELVNVLLLPLNSPLRKQCR